MADLSFKQLSKTNEARAALWHNAGTEQWTVADWAVALAGEAGEVCDAVKKLRRIETGTSRPSVSGEHLDNADAAKAAIAKEIADTVLYCDLLATFLEIDLSEAVRSKFNEVSKRYDFPQRL